jgi:hypothetical protein
VWEAAYLTRVGKFPDLGPWIDPPRTRKLDRDAAEQHAADFARLVAQAGPPPDSEETPCLT